MSLASIDKIEGAPSEGNFELTFLFQGTGCKKRFTIGSTVTWSKDGCSPFDIATISIGAQCQVWFTNSTVSAIMFDNQFILVGYSTYGY